MTSSTTSPLRPPSGRRPPAVPLAEAMRRAADDQAPSPYIQDALAVDLACADDEHLFGPQRTARADLPDPHEWAGQISQGIVEVMAGLRPAAQVVRWTTPQVYAVIARRGALAARRRATRVRAERRRPLVRRVHVCEPADGVAECSVVVTEGPRVRAMALRLAGQDGRWRVEALQLG